MRTKDYIKAVATLLSEGRDAERVLADLKSVLERRGHTKLYGAILKGVMQSFEAHASRDQATIVVERANDTAKHEASITAALELLGVKTEPKTLIDETIIGGFKVVTGAQSIDRSYKKQLVALYRALTD